MDMSDVKTPLIDADAFEECFYDALDEIEDESSGYESTDTNENENHPPRTPRRKQWTGFDSSIKFRYGKNGSFKFKSTSLLCEDLKLILELPEMCDITFLVGVKQVPVHAVRAILGTRSRVFYQLILQQQQKRSIANNEKKKQLVSHRLYIPVKKYEPEVFQTLIQYVHSGTVTITHDNVTGLLCGAGQFHLDELEDACWEFIRRCLVSGKGETLLEPTRRYKHFRVSETILKEIYALLDKRFPNSVPLESTV